MAGDLTDFERLIIGLCEAYGHKPTAARIALYERALSDLTVAELKGACLRAVRESKFFPTIAELRSHVEPGTDDAALLAWTALQQAQATVGAYSSLVVEDGAAGAALVAVFGSWPEFCGLPDVAVQAHKAEFMAAYRQARRSHDRGVARLPGALDAGTAAQPDGTAVWAGLITAAGDVQSFRDAELEARLASRPKRSLALGGLLLKEKSDDPKA